MYWVNSLFQFTGSLCTLTSFHGGAEAPCSTSYFCPFIKDQLTGLSQNFKPNQVIEGSVFQYYDSLITVAL